MDYNFDKCPECGYINRNRPDVCPSCGCNLAEYRKNAARILEEEAEKKQKKKNSSRKT